MAVGFILASIQIFPSKIGQIQINSIKFADERLIITLNLISKQYYNHEIA